MQDSTQSLTEEIAAQVEPVNGKDEMNLAEFPLVKLGKRDKRKVITYERYVKSQGGVSYCQKWEVHGSAGFGLPDETGDRVLVAFMKLTAEQGFQSPKVMFSPYRILQMLGWRTDGRPNYDALERVLRQLVAVTVFSENAFYENKAKKRVTYNEAFHIIEKVRWVRKKQQDRDVEDDETHQAYIIWGDVFWKSLESGYIKNLDLGFYYSLDNAVARRLYRFLDKWLYQRSEWEFDIFDVAGRLGMVRYKYPSEAKKALRPACDELKDRGFLVDYEFYKKGKYTRIRFIKATKSTRLGEELNQRQTTTSAEMTGEVNTPDENANIPDHWMVIFDEYGTTEELQDVWEKVLQELKQVTILATFQTHLTNTALLSVENDEAVIGVANIAGTDWLENRMERTIRTTLNFYLDTSINALKFISVRDHMQPPVQ